MKILHVISSIDPKGGGVIEGVNQLSFLLSKMGHQVEICSKDSPLSKFVLSSEIKVHALGPVTGTYGYNKLLVGWLKAYAHEYDAIFVNGLWQYHSFAVWRALAAKKIPYYVFPHGMLGPWFKYTYPLKHLKKWLYWPWAEYRVLRDARRVIFTCEEERLLAKKSFWLYRANEEVVVSGIANPPLNNDELQKSFLDKYKHLQNKRIILFLGRIHKVKGCDLLIEAFAKISARDQRLHLVMAGPDQINWARELKTKALNLGVAERITWTGMLNSDMKWAAIYASEVFCLPSHHENFGIVVAEALACGKPVLISNKVNIWREIEADGAGLVAEDTVSGTLNNLERWLDMTHGEFDAMQAKTQACFMKHFHVQRAAERLIEIIETSK